ncbi:MAG: TonB-dependent receptor [Allosphingosinicella sp.]
MKPGLRLIAGLLAGSASAGLQAQETAPSAFPDPPPPAQAAPAGTEPAENVPPEEVEFTDREGNPLPPEQQRELRERLKDKLPTLVTRPQAPDPPADRQAKGGEVIVTGQRPRGSVIGDIPPERSFDLLDIRAFGANDIAGLLDVLGPQVASGRGRGDSGPVVLLNGKRVSSFAEIAKFPTEAIERMEVFPEELALKYGYRADQKVVNIITRERFSSRIGQLAYTVPTDGGRDTVGLNANYLHIAGDNRITLDAEYGRSSPLRESERTIVRAPGPPGSSRFRTLLPETRRLALNGTVSGDWLSGVSSTLNGRFEATESESLFGLGADGPLQREVDTRSAHLGTTLGGRAGKWLWSFTGNYDRATLTTFTDIGVAPGAKDEARSVNAVADADLLLSGTLFNLPAGPITTSLNTTAETRDFSSRSLRGGVRQSAALSRDSIGARASFDLPIASRSKKKLRQLGDLSANLSLAFDSLSDFGTLRTFSYGLNWRPVEGVNLNASATNEEGAPTAEQLASPLVVTPNVRTFDFTRREVVDITRIFGGNPGLRSDDRHVLALGLNARPFSETDFILSFNYIKTRIDDPIAPFPIATPEIEAAFPQRFERDPNGRLLRIDSSPLNFRRSDQEQLRFGIDFTKPLGPVPAHMRKSQMRIIPSGQDPQSALPPGAVIVTAQPGSAAMKQFENASSRLTLSLYYTAHLVDEILVREGGPVLDLLDGSATDARGGRPRHQLEFQATVFKKGLGARVKVHWQSGSLLRGLSAGPAAGSGDLTFSSHANVSVNIFANLGERFGAGKSSALLGKTRASLSIENLFNRRPQVRDSMGLTPFSYQPAFLDPLGRLVSFTLRKVF